MSQKKSLVSELEFQPTKTSIQSTVAIKPGVKSDKGLGVTRSRSPGVGIQSEKLITSRQSEPVSAAGSTGQRSR